MDAPPPPHAEDLLRKIQELEAADARLREVITRLMRYRPRPDPDPDPERRSSRSLSRIAGQPRRLSGGEGKEVLVSFGESSSSRPLMDEQYVSILQSMGQSVHVLDRNFRVVYWNRSAENLYGYSAEEAMGKTILELIVEPHDTDKACDIVDLKNGGKRWIGQFPVRHKMGNRFLVTGSTTQIYDDDGTLIGAVVVSSASQPFLEVKVSIADAKDAEPSQSFNQPMKSVTTKLGLNPEQALQIAVKLTNLASKVSNKVRSKLNSGEIDVPREGSSGDSRHSDHGFPDDPVSDHEDDGCFGGASTPEGDPVATVVLFSQVGGKAPAKSQRESIDENEWKTGIKVLTSKAEAWLGKKTKRWSWKGIEHDISEASSGRFPWPRLRGEQDADHPNSSVKSESHGVEYSQSAANEASGFYCPFHVNSTSSCSCGSSSNSVVNKLDMESDCLDYEIMWEDLKVEERIGQGSCGTVYHGFWCGSNVAIKVFSKLEYSDDAILSFRQEVSLMKRLRHPNILLFMGAVTSPQRLCIVTEFLPRGSLFHLLQRSTSKLDWRRRIHIAIDVAQGMNYLHKCKPPVIHRDLKSSNLLVDKNWTVKVADFGLSRVKHETYLASKTSKGTPQWMAPELLCSEPADEKSDVYSFGVILWELITQKVPWHDLTAMQVIAAVGFMNQRLEIPNDVDIRWTCIIESCWHSEPRERPTFQELLGMLKDLRRQYNIEFRAGSSDSTQTEL